MINYMNQAIAHAELRTEELNAKLKSEGSDRRVVGLASGWVDTPHGELKVCFVVAQGVTTYTARHLRKNWTLNGKRIAANKLEGMCQFNPHP